MAIVTERQRDTAATQPAIGAGPNGAKACYCRSRSPLRITPRPSPARHCRNHSWLAQGARFAPCVLSVAALLSPKSPENRVLGCRPEMAVQATQIDLTRARCYLLTNSAQFARLFLPSIPHRPPESLLVACWLFAGCLLVACLLLAGCLLVAC